MPSFINNHQEKLTCLFFATDLRGWVHKQGIPQVFSNCGW